jgi:hypothetical protein
LPGFVRRHAGRLQFLHPLIEMKLKLVVKFGLRFLTPEE